MASHAGQYSAGMSRCYYSMLQAMLDFLQAQVSAGRISADDYKRVKEPGGHGVVSSLMKNMGFDRPLRRGYSEAMSRRKKADYDPDPIVVTELEASLTDAESLRAYLAERSRR